MRNCLSVTIEMSVVFQQHLLRREMSRWQEQSGEPGETAGETKDSRCTTGRLAVKWVLPFIVSAWSLTIHCNILHAGIS